MTTGQIIKSIRALSEWIISTSVLCTLLTFFPPVSESGISQRGIAQIELRASTENGTGRILHYNLAIGSKTETLFDSRGSINPTALLLCYERTVETRFLNNLEHWISYNKPGKLARTPYTRRSYYESAFNSLRG